MTWLHSYVTAGELYCVYDADDPSLIYEHARAGDFPADVVAEVARMIAPTTGAGAAAS